MLSHRFRILFPVALLGVLLAGAPAPAFQRLSVITGQFTSFAAANNLLSVNTRLGPRQFRTTAATLTFLNGRQAVLGDIQLNDAVTVRFRFDNLEVARVDVTREAKGRGRIRNTTATTIELVTGNGLLTLRTDTLSRVDLDDIPLTNRTVLNGSGFSATTVYEPRGLTILSMRVTGVLVVGRLNAVTAGTRTLTVQARRQPETIVLDANASILRNGVAATVADLVVGDRVRVSILRGTTVRGLAMEARTP